MARKRVLKSAIENKSKKYLIEKDINYVEEYVKNIDKEKVFVNKEIKIIYKKLLNDIQKYKNNSSGKYFYDNKEALNFINFCQNECVVKGGKRGQMVRLMLFQKALGSALFGFRKINTNGDSVRKFEVVAYIIGRKNGKTYFSAMVILYLILSEGLLETCRGIFSAGNDLKQSKAIWDDVLYIINNNPKLKSKFKLTLSQNKLTYIRNDDTFQPVASNSTQTLDGLRANIVVFDEVHEFKQKKNGGILNLLKKAMSTAKIPLVFICSTFGYTRDSVFDSEMLTWKYLIRTIEEGKELRESQERILPIIYKLDHEKELYPLEGDTFIDKYKNWQKPNPSIDFIDIKSEKIGMKQLEYLINTFEDIASRGDITEFRDMIVKDFNIIQGTKEAFLSFTEVENLETFNLEEIQKSENPFKYGFAGFDLSRIGDLTALCILLKRKGDPKLYLVPFFYIPKKSYLDKVKNTEFPYDKWYDKGYLEFAGEDIIDTTKIVEAIREFEKKYKIMIVETVYDRWSASEVIIKLQEYYGKKNTRALAMDKKTQTEPLERLMFLLKSKDLVYNNNELLKFCFLNTQLEYSKDGKFFQAVKSCTEEKIDGTIAAICCIDSYLKNKEKYYNLIF